MDVTVAVVDSKIDYKQFQNSQKEAEQNKDKNDVACKSVFVQMAYFSSRGQSENESSRKMKSGRKKKREGDRVEQDQTPEAYETPYNEPESQDIDPKTRNAFVRKVFLIVLLMLTVTAIFNVIVNVTPSLVAFFMSPKGWITLLFCSILYSMLSFALCCCDRLVYPPFIVVIVVLTVICISVITAYATVKTETKLVIFALVATAALVMVLIMIAYSSWDFTRWWNYIIAASVALFAVSLAISIYSWSTGERMKTVKIVICIIGTVVNSVVLIMELQSIIGGKTVELEEELYLYGAWQLYTSIVHIFLKLLRIMRHFGD